ncbi:MAG: alpha/beta hydrolase, partial [Verrucomicrobiota bacterium]
ALKKALAMSPGSHGVGVAVINYRLQPQVQWRDQVRDVAHALAWVRSNISQYSGDARRIYLMGHSAGAHLAAQAALNPEFALERDTSGSSLCGVISVSGAALDLSDAKTYALGQKLSYYEARFRDAGANWQAEASPINFITLRAPPFLILYAGGETKALQRQSRLLNDALLTHGVKSDLILVPGQSHARIVLALSRGDKVAGPAILDFIENTRSSAPVPQP